MEFIRVCEPVLGGNELEYVSECVRDNWISSAGKFVTEFENQFAEYSDCKFGVTVTNGTAALHLAAVALGLGPGDEVIMPNFTMIASAFALCYTGAKPVFVDVDRQTWNINTKLIEEKITDKTKAIMAVDIFGQPADYDEIQIIAKSHGLKIIEDAAQAHGAEYNGKRCGSLGDVGCFSLFANKLITTGEGGVITTSDHGLYDKLRYHKNLCFPLDGPRNYIHEDIGFNYRMPNTLAAIGLAQLEKIDEYIANRRRNGEKYARMLGEIKGVQVQKIKPDNKSVYWMNSIVLEDSIRLSRDEFMDQLKENNIDSRMLFAGMNRQPALIKYGCDPNGDFHVSDRLYERGLYLPSGSNLTDQQVEYVVEKVAAIVKANS